ncbi:hypothetical protein P4U78_14390 [Bacillus pseudomycoides]|nr:MULTISPECIES: hypothetical protein [Bacillus]MED1596732.1 hypothetical protein [Bacillus pseudomycoides]MED4712538.1 hypothetical protein [Bacillus pseudomycoides]
MNQKEETSEWLVEHLTSQPTGEIADYEIHFQTALKRNGRYRMGRRYLGYI